MTQTNKPADAKSPAPQPAKRGYQPKPSNIDPAKMQRPGVTPVHAPEKKP